MTNKFKYLLSAVIFILSYVLMIGGVSADNSCQIEMRTLVETLNNKTCFSTTPQPACNVPCVPAHTRGARVDFYCVTTDSGPFSQTEGQKVDAILTVSIPTSCKLPYSLK